MAHSSGIIAPAIEHLVIIGSGPAGLTAAIYAARAHLNPLLIQGKSMGGQLMGTTTVENWPGEASIMGPQLMLDMVAQVKKLGVRIRETSVMRINTKQQPFLIECSDNETISAHALIIATGATPRKLGCPGESEYWGRGVSTCPVCDGAFYNDRPVVIVGGGDSAMEAASFMRRFTSSVNIVHILDRLTASEAMQERVINDPHITILYESTVTEIHGNGEHVTGISVTHQKKGDVTKIATDAVFVTIGLIPNTQMLGEEFKRLRSGHLLVTEHTHTSVEGAFAAGDVADVRYRQAITSAGSGCMAALDAQEYLKQKNII